MTISNPARFTLPDGEGALLPISIPPGGFRDIRVQFTESGPTRGYFQETLTINTSDPNNPVNVITLGGSYALGVGGADEPPLSQLRDTFGYTMDIGTPTNDLYTAQGSEILSPRWVRADPSQPIYIRQLAAYHGTNTNNIRLFRALDNNPNGPIATITAMTHDADDFNSILPLINGETGPGEVFSNPSPQEFQVMIAGLRGGRSADFGQAHGLRFWPIRNPNGQLAPNAYMVAQDFVGCCFGGETNDYNDNVYLITNIAPFTPSPVDIEVTKTDSVDPVQVNTSFTYTVSVENLSLFDASGVTLTDTLPANFNFTSASASNGGSCSQAAGVVTCNLGIVLGETTVTVDIVGSATATGIIQNTANATTTSAETNTVNNATTESTTVFDPANLPGDITIVKGATPAIDQNFQFSGSLGAFQLNGSTSPVSNGADYSFNFQRATFTTPPGYTAELGLPYGPQAGGDTYGWVTEATLGNPTPTPIDITSSARTRASSPLTTDPRQLSYTHMQRADCCTTGVLDPVAWEIMVPNGVYNVTVGAGDDQAGSVHRINVEGVTAINFTSIPTMRYDIQTVQVTVTDGRLTMDAIGGTNTKPNFIDIANVPQINNSITFSNIPPGNYDVTELATPGWSLTGVTCSSPQTVVGSTVTIALPSGGNVTCTFNNALTTGPAVAIAKDADQTINSGDAANFTITVTNIGAVDLTNVVVSDPASPACNNNLGTISVGASANYTCAQPNVTTTYTNTASVTSTEGATASDSATVTVLPPLVPSIAVDKLPDTQTVNAGDTVTFSMEVSNNGQTDLTNIVVTDPICTTGPTFVSGDGGVAGTMEVGETWIYSCDVDGAGVTVDFTNTVNVQGQAPDTSIVQAQDTASVTVTPLTPAITLTKDADQTVVSGGTASFTITLENTGTVDLTTVAVTDALTPTCDNTFATLAVGAVETYTCQQTNVTATYTNTADVTTAEGATASDTAVVTVVAAAPAITLTKDADQTINPGGTATFTITLVNTGNIDLTNVDVTDALTPDCDNNFATLAVGATQAYTCQLLNVTADYHEFRDGHDQ